MTDMHRLGDIGSAEIEHGILALARFRRAEPRIPGHRARTLGERHVGHVEIDEARSRDLHFREQRIVFQPGGNFLSQRTWIGLRGLGGRERAVALELREVLPVRCLYRAELRRQSFGRERRLRDRRQFRGERRHCVKRPIVRL